MRRSVPALAALALAACSASPVVTTRTLTIHAPKACAPGASPYALFQPLGDFEAQGATPPSIPLADVGAQLAGFPPATAEIVATVADATSAQWDAHAVLAATGNVDLLALPVGAPCALTDPIGARAGAVLGAVDAGHVLVVGGMASAAGGAVPATALVDLTRGTVSTLAAGLLTPRTEATVTAWSGGAVVAGGVQPPSSGGSTEASFEVYSSALGDFTGAKFALSQARARHGAAVLASGETLLVGGVDGTGAVLGSMEAIDATTQRARTAGLGQLAVPRADPVVMRLASGEILVAGGVDGNGAPVPTLEWFARDASASSRATQDLVASSHEAFVPLAAGGALAVIAPDTATPGFQNVWVITAAGGLEAATPIDGTLSDARLFDGTAQSPVLWTGDRWLQWQPWQGVFTALAPAFGAPGPSGDPIASPEPGLGVWIDGAAIDALRFGARGPYVSETTPLLVGDTSFTGPDRLAGADPAGAIVFDATAGLSLQLGASVFVTDATYASFALDAETPGASPPSVVLRDASGNETVLDAASCPVAPSATLHVERDGDGVVRASSGGSLVRCTVAPASAARVSIGVRGQSSMATSVVRSLAITRL